MTGAPAKARCISTGTTGVMRGRMPKETPRSETPVIKKPRSKELARERDNEPPPGMGTAVSEHEATTSDGCGPQEEG